MMKHMIIITCDHCKKTHPDRRTNLKKFKHHFCSRVCKQTFQKVHAVPPNVRFWRHVKKSPNCWIWTGGRFGSYGVFTVTTRIQVKAHRFSYTQSKGLIPEGLCVCHTCDVKLCVRPSHLFLGTIRDNVLDAISKNKFVTGERNGSSKLTAKEVALIRKSWIPYKVSQRHLAKQFGVHFSTIQVILSNKSWKHYP